MYKLADNIELIEESLKDGSKEYIVAVFRNKYKDYIVNKITFDFMQEFKAPISLDLVINQYVKLTKAKGDKILLVKNQLTVFFNDLSSKGWIVGQEETFEEKNHETKYVKGDLINDYKVLSVLANNALIDVYLVKSKGSPKKFVLKYLNYTKFKNKERYGRYQGYMLKEFEFLKVFNSIYINKGFKFNKEVNSCYILLQFINGESVSKYLKSNRLLVGDKIGLVSKILKGFSLIHENSIYHGDIHLSNILVTQKKQVKIIDFGYSNHTNEDTSNQRKTRNGGVHAFIPPERALRSIDRKFNAVEQYQSEVYQIGLIIYYIFFKTLPFKANTWKTMVDEKNDFNIHEYEPFLKRRMPKKVRQIIIKSLETNPNDRYSKAKDMLADWKLI